MESRIKGFLNDWGWPKEKVQPAPFPIKTLRRSPLPSITSHINQLSFSDTIRIPADDVAIQVHAAKDADLVQVSSHTYIENVGFKGKAIPVGPLILSDGETSSIQRKNNVLRPSDAISFCRSAGK